MRTTAGKPFADISVPLTTFTRDSFSALDLQALMGKVKIGARIKKDASILLCNRRIRTSEINAWQLGRFIAIYILNDLLAYNHPRGDVSATFGSTLNKS
jgi:hypothetical protein